MGRVTCRLHQVAVVVFNTSAALEFDSEYATVNYTRAGFLKFSPTRPDWRNYTYYKMAAKNSTTIISSMYQDHVSKYPTLTVAQRVTRDNGVYMCCPCHHRPRLVPRLTSTVPTELLGVVAIDVSVCALRNVAQHQTAAQNSYVYHYTSHSEAPHMDLVVVDNNAVNEDPSWQHSVLTVIAPETLQHHPMSTCSEVEVEAEVPSAAASGGGGSDNAGVTCAYTAPPSTCVMPLSHRPPPPDHTAGYDSNVMYALQTVYKYLMAQGTSEWCNDDGDSDRRLASKTLTSRAIPNLNWSMLGVADPLPIAQAEALWLTSSALFVAFVGLVVLFSCQESKNPMCGCARKRDTPRQAKLRQIALALAITLPVMVITHVSWADVRSATMLHSIVDATQSVPMDDHAVSQQAATLAVAANMLSLSVAAGVDHVNAQLVEIGTRALEHGGLPVTQEALHDSEQVLHCTVLWHPPTRPPAHPPTTPGS